MRKTTVFWVTMIAFAAGGFVGSAAEHQNARKLPYKPDYSGEIAIHHMQPGSVDQSGVYQPFQVSINNTKTRFCDPPDSGDNWIILLDGGRTQIYATRTNKINP